MMHLPHLKELHELYDLVALCDISPGTLGYVADYYHVSKRFTDHHALLKESLDAVLVLSADSHGQVIVDALKAGKHVLTEKRCASRCGRRTRLWRQEAGRDRLHGRLHERHDPGFRYAQPLIQGMKNLQAITITVLHPTSQTGRPSRHPAVHGRTRQRPRQAPGRPGRPGREAIGDFTPLERRVFANNLLSTLVHDVNVLRGLSGDPEEVLFTDVWHGGEGMVTCLRYASGVRAMISLQYLPDLAITRRPWPITARGPRASGLPVSLLSQRPHPGRRGRHGGREAFEKTVIASMKEAFKEELLYFAGCVNQVSPITTPEEARGDVALLHKIFHAIKRRWHEIHSGDPGGDGGGPGGRQILLRQLGRARGIRLKSAKDPVTAADCGGGALHPRPASGAASRRSLPRGRGHAYRWAGRPLDRRSARRTMVFIAGLPFSPFASRWNGRRGSISGSLYLPRLDEMSWPSGAGRIL